MNMRTTLASAALASAVVAAASVSVPATPAYAGPAVPDVPGAIAVEEGHKLYLVGHAVGVQRYTCNGTSWTFDGPRAAVYNDHGVKIASHYGGPTWEARDGSRVIGTRVDGVTVDPTAIPWLLLSATSFAGADGDRLAGTTFIQRVQTVGGLAPAAATCTSETLGEVQEVPYTADYNFWKAST